MAKKKNIKTNGLKAVVIATAVVMFWRGAWGLMDLYLLPNNAALSFAASAAMGVLLLLFIHKLDVLD